MKLSAIALDFDGTIAVSGALDAGVRAATGELRAHGVCVILATGRILAELRLVCPDLQWADAVVAENGAVVWFPASGYRTILGQPPQQAFLDALRQRGLRFGVGLSIVDLDATAAHEVLDVVRQLEVPLALAFNRGRLMALPQAVSKASGLHFALTALRLSPHNTVAIGDAENDHELLRLCGLGVAVGWGSPALQRAADLVLPGDGPPAVAGFLRRLDAEGMVPLAARTRRRLRLGLTDAGLEVDLPVDGANILVTGNPKSGKSWLAGLMCEQLILQGYSVCVIDAEGDYASLRALPGMLAMGGTLHPPRPRELLHALRHPDSSLIVDLSHLAFREKRDYVRAVLPGLETLRRQTGLPHRVLIDEAHYFLGADADAAVTPGADGHIFVTYHASQLDLAVIRSCGSALSTRESDEAELSTAYRRFGTPEQPAPSFLPPTAEQWNHTLGSLLIGEAAIVWPPGDGVERPRRFRLASRLTPHVRHVAKYVDMPVASGQAFVFDPYGRPTRANSLREFVTALDRLPDAAVAPHLEHRDFSRWVAEVFGDLDLAIAIRRIETQKDAPAGAARADITREVKNRYDLLEPTATPLLRQ
jgi:hydroxymethylpyrimidine pyrophosphatase-like HAD family hydrolase